jgi:HEAT repeat protein
VEKPVEPATNPAPQIAMPVAASTNTAPEYASEAAHRAAIDAEKKLLVSLSMNDDPQSLSNILAALSSPEKEVRMAAIDAAKQFEDTNAIPALRAAAATAEPNEAIAMLKAVNWLSTPSVEFSPPGGFTKPDLTADQSQALQASQNRAAIRQSANATIKATQQKGQNGAVGGNNNGRNDNQTQPAPGPGSGAGDNTGATGPTQQ